jgi:limonene-1,2-epoxide hydrolase
VHRQFSQGDVVMNECTDVMRRNDGGRLELPVMGVFEVRDGRIVVWRDYFDMATVTAASVRARERREYPDVPARA